MYHEMLHHVEPPIEKLGERRRIHHRGFSAREKEFQEYALAQEFRKTIRDEWFKPQVVMRRKRRVPKHIRLLSKNYQYFYLSGLF
jgi:hypothetical protein